MINSLRIDVDGNITIAQGATGFFNVTLEEVEQLDTEKDKAVFAIGAKKGPEYTTAFQRTYDIYETDEGYTVMVELANEDTRELTPDKYYWNLMIVTDAGEDAGGNTIADDRTDQVYPIFTSSEQPIFRVEGVTYVV